MNRQLNTLCKELSRLKCFSRKNRAKRSYLASFRLTEVLYFLITTDHLYRSERGTGCWCESDIFSFSIHCLASKCLFDWTKCDGEKCSSSLSLARPMNRREREKKRMKRKWHRLVLPSIESHLYWLLNDHYLKLIAPLRIEKESHRAFNWLTFNHLIWPI